MTVANFMYYSVDVDWQDIEIYDIDKNKTVYRGYYADIPEKYDNAEVISFDIVDTHTDHITFNVSLEN